MGRDELEADGYGEGADEMRVEARLDEASVTSTAPCIRKLLDEVHREEDAAEIEREEE